MKIREIAPRIVLDQKAAPGKPRIKGTRVPAEVVAEKVATGMTFHQVAQAYGITRADVLAATSYVARKAPAGGGPEGKEK